MGLRPVNSLKHVVDTNGLVTLALASVTDVINTVDNPSTVVSNQVNVGCRVNAIYLRVEVKGGAVAASGVENIYMYVFKNPGNNLVQPAADAIGVSDNRKFVIHQEMLMTNVSTAEASFPRTLFKGVIMIPRGYRRFGVDDRLKVILQQRAGETNQTTQFCIECIYKEFQ